MKPLASVAIAAMILPTAAMSVEFQGWIRFGEKIAGESTDPGHEGWSDVQRFSAEKLGDEFTMTCHREIDAASQALITACTEGTVFEEVRIDLSRSNEGSRRDFWELSLGNVVVRSYRMEGGTDGTPLEHLTLSWESLSFTYHVFPDAGTPYPVSRLVSADDDRDTLPNAYEEQVGLDPEISNLRTDSDKDGTLDVDEYRLGTGPLDPTSFFSATASLADPGTGQFLLKWPSIAGETYDIEFTPDLTTPFQHHASVVATGSETTRSIARSMAAGFYRVTKATP